MCLSPSTSLLESPKEVLSALSSSYSTLRPPWLYSKQLNCKTFCRRHHHLPPHHQPARLKCPPRGSGCPTTVGVRLAHALPPTKMPNHAHHQTNVTSSNPPTPYTTTTSKQPTQPNTRGIHIHSTLNWNTHMNKTAQRTNTTSAFLHRNIRTCPRKTKHLAYTTLVRPILEYASIIWDPHTASNINKLETVQRRSARHMHIYNRHVSVTTMLQHLDLPTTTTPPALQNHHAIQNHTPTSQHSNHHLHHTIHLEYWTPHPALCPHTCIRNIFFPQYHQHKKLWNNLQPVITNSTTTPQLRQALQSTQTSGRRGAPCSAGAE